MYRKNIVTNLQIGLFLNNKQFVYIREKRYVFIYGYTYSYLLTTARSKFLVFKLPTHRNLEMSGKLACIIYFWLHSNI